MLGLTGRMPIMKRAAIYARVSTRNGHQDPETQLLALRQVAERAGWQVVEEYLDHGISGAKGRDQRPAFDRLLKDATRRRFDVVMAWSVDRLGRSLQDLVAFLGEVHAQGVDLYLDRQGVDTTTPGGKALFQMMGVFAEFERAMIRERVCAGLDKARAKGKRLGRPTVPPSVERSILAARAAGKGQLAIARDLGVGVSTVRRVLGAGTGISPL
jgi:DNA invertase Pin-like site-specific DNA recombinase